MAGIYRITNIKTNDTYIGQSKRVERRIPYHFQSNYQKFHSKKVRNDIEKYGKEGFKVELIEECREEDLLKREAYHIAREKPTYNSIYVGHPVSEESRAKISRSLTGKKQPEEVKEKRRKSILERHKIYPQLNLGHRKKCRLDTGEVFESVKATAAHLGCHPSSVTHALKHGQRIKGHKVWYEV